MDEICYRPIGVIHSAFKKQGATPIQSAFSKSPGTAEVFPRYAPGLKDLEGFSHIFLIYHFHRAAKSALVESPFLDPGSERGIFSIRHFNRPNPIGLSVVELKAVKNNVLELGPVDILDGTPLLDIKPYVCKFDRPENPRCGWFDEKGIGQAQGEIFTPDTLRQRKL